MYAVASSWNSKRKAVTYMRETVLEQSAASFESLAQDWRAAGPGGFWRVGSALAGLFAAVREVEVIGRSKADILGSLDGVRAICAQSPFCIHAQEWPRGYEGDFEIVEHIVAQENCAEPDTFEWNLEQHLLTGPMAQQHINKILHQANLITEVLLSKSSESVTVLMIASGAAADLRRVPPSLVTGNVRFVLNDADPDALSLAEKLLGEIGDRLTLVPGNVLRAIDTLADHGPYDLVLAGGLFDYLPDRVAGRLIGKVLQRLCKPGGLFYFSNIGAGNEFRVLLEYLLNWPLIERSEGDIRNLVAPHADLLSGAAVSFDPTALTLLVELRRSEAISARTNLILGRASPDRSMR